MLVIVPIIALVCAPALWLVLGKPRYLNKATSTTQTLRRNKPPPSISIIIPARNEAHNLEPLLNSINKQNVKPHEILVIDDQSDDGTVTVARNHQAIVVSGRPLPEGWKGKNWACQQGADAATGDLFLFLDADTRLAPSFIQELLGVYQDNPGLLSIAPYHRIKQPYEELSAFFNIVMLAGVNAFGTGTSSGENTALFGQCLLISRHNYSTLGGHSSVKAEVLENFKLSKQCTQHNIQKRCFLGRGSIEMRMFPMGYHELCQSWKKGFTAGASSTAPRALILSSIWISGAMCTLVAIILSASSYRTEPLIISTSLVYLIYVFQCRYAFRLAGNFSWFNALLFPISLLFYQCLFFSSLIDKRRKKTILWKGRPTD